jgi:hypothetical protein
MGHKKAAIRSLDILNDDDNDNDRIAMEEEKCKMGYAFNAAVMVDFMDSVIPNRNLFKEKKGNMLNIIVLNHDYFKAFSGATMNISRFCRFLGFVIIVLSEIFTDTLFFGIFYPSDGTCNVYTTEVRKLLCDLHDSQRKEFLALLMQSYLMNSRSILYVTFTFIFRVLVLLFLPSFLLIQLNALGTPRHLLAL